MICNILLLYVFSVIARVVISYLEVPGHHPVGRLVALLSKLVDPPLRSIRRVLPAIPIGSIQLDLSPLVLIFAITLVRRVLCG